MLYDCLMFACEGTLLCPDCANRHVSMSEEVRVDVSELLVTSPNTLEPKCRSSTCPQESRIKSLDDDRWNLRSVLALLEGGNGKMLDYIKEKPRWRPPKNKSSDAVPEDVLAFQLIYLSKAAGAYRKELVQQVDDVFYGQIMALRDRDREDEELLEEVRRMADLAADDPFARLFADKMPGGLDAGRTAASGGAFDDGDGDAVPSAGKARAVERKGRHASTPLMKHEAPSVELIKERINARRNMNRSIRMEERREDFDARDLENGYAEGVLPPASSVEPSHKRAPKDPRLRVPSDARRVSDMSVRMVGEVGGVSIQEHDDRLGVPSNSRRRPTGMVGELGGASIQEQNDPFSDMAGPLHLKPMPQTWGHQHEDDQTGISGQISYASRSRAQPLGVYQRRDNRGGGLPVTQNSFVSFPQGGQ